MKQPYVLRARKCRSCNSEIPGVTADAKPVSPKSMSECLRRCACGKGGFSNGKSPTWIFAEPSDNVPLEVRAGLTDALAESVNERGRKIKLFQFGFETSEDAVTWTVFRYLQQSGRLRAQLAASGNIVAARAQAEPAMLFWGSPVPAVDAMSRQVRSRLLEILQGLGEERLSYSEPDVLLDFNEAGMVAIEAKYRSENDRKAEHHTGWKTYLNREAFRDPVEAKKTGLYELARNWRIAWELSGGRPTSLVNLGASRLASDKDVLERFHAALATGPDRQFQSMTWTQLLGDVSDLPPWLRSWLESRSITGAGP